MQQINSTLEVAADKLAVLAANARYFRAVEVLDADAYLAEWTPDGCFEAAEGPARGFTELRQHFGNLVHRHFLVTSAVVDVHGDAAHHRCYVAVLERRPAARVVATAVFYDELRRTPQGWKFARRHANIAPLRPLAQLHAAVVHSNAA